MTHPVTAAVAPPAPTHNPDHLHHTLAVLGGESFTPTKGDDHGIANIIDTKRIKYPDSSNGPPGNKVDRKSSTTPKPPPGPPAPGSAVLNGAHATRHNPLRPATVLMPWRRRTTVLFVNARKLATVTVEAILRDHPERLLGHTAAAGGSAKRHLSTTAIYFGAPSSS
ncbi:hypothetical protein P692DRAFT_20876317 [Suillus brevipes Sb2]|nr:hypothetical protein P692DRAFT_20876317 [Suillus brevipes Sb2]